VETHFREVSARKPGFVRVAIRYDGPRDMSALKPLFGRFRSGLTHVKRHNIRLSEYSMAFADGNLPRDHGRAYLSSYILIYPCDSAECQVVRSQAQKSAI
jgi:hypothetical protein